MTFKGQFFIKKVSKPAKVTKTLYPSVKQEKKYRL